MYTNVQIQQLSVKFGVSMDTNQFFKKLDQIKLCLFSPKALLHFEPLNIKINPLKIDQ